MHGSFSLTIGRETGNAERWKMYIGERKTEKSGYKSTDGEYLKTNVNVEKETNERMEVRKIKKQETEVKSTIAHWKRERERERGRT